MEWIDVKDKLPQTLESVLVCFKNANGGRFIGVAQYIAPKTVLSEDFLDPDSTDDSIEEYDEKEDCYYVKENWFESSYVSEINWCLESKVTHWMPLPELPKIE